MLKKFNISWIYLLYCKCWAPIWFWLEERAWGATQLHMVACNHTELSINQSSWKCQQHSLLTSYNVLLKTNICLKSYILLNYKQILKKTEKTLEHLPSNSAGPTPTIIMDIGSFEAFKRRRKRSLMHYLTSASNRRSENKVSKIHAEIMF